MSDWIIILVALAAFVGSIVAGLLGYVESHEAWDTRKFMSTVLRGVISAVIFAVVYDYSSFTGLLSYLAAFLGGAGVDVLGNRIAASIANRNQSGQPPT